MNYVVLCVITVAAMETFLRLPFLRLTKEVLQLNLRAKRVIGLKSASDHWKEKTLQAYSGKIMSKTITLALCMVVVVAIVGVLALAFDSALGLEPSSLKTLASVPGVIGSLVVACLYGFLRGRLVRN